MSDPGFLALMLDAPLMSWGVSSRFQRRTTELHPSRSAISGMICAAAGADKGSEAERMWLEKLDAVHFTILTIPRPRLDREGTLAIRRMEDYHTVSGTRSADNPRPKKEAVLTYRQYLLDARFGVILQGASDVLADIAKALSDPKWGIWFGRKACLPAAPVLRGAVRPSREVAINDLGLDPDNADVLVCVSDAASFAEGTDTLMDIPLNFQTRTFKPRRITRRPGQATG